MFHHTHLTVKSSCTITVSNWNSAPWLSPFTSSIYSCKKLWKPKLYLHWKNITFFRWLFFCAVTQCSVKPSLVVYDVKAAWRDGSNNLLMLYWCLSATCSTFNLSVTPWPPFSFTSQTYFYYYYFWAYGLYQHYHWNWRKSLYSVDPSPTSSVKHTCSPLSTPCLKSLRT